MHLLAKEYSSYMLSGAGLTAIKRRMTPGGGSGPEQALGAVAPKSAAIRGSSRRSRRSADRRAAVDSGQRIVMPPSAATTWPVT